MKSFENIIAHFGIVLVLSVHLLLVSINIKQPWVGDDFDGALLSIAHNYVEYGFIETRLGQVMNYEYEPVDRDHPMHYYQHHPPLWTWLLGVTFKIAGEGEAQARLLPIVFSVVGLILLYRLMEAAYGGRVAFLAGFIYAVLPVTAFYGHHPTHEPLTTALMLAIAVLYMRWLQQPRQRNLFLLSLVYTLTMLSGWPAYLLAGLLPVHYLLINHKVGKTWIFPLISVVVFCAHFLHSAWLQPGTFQDSLKFLFAYTGVVGREEIKQMHLDSPFSAKQYFTVVGSNMVLLFSIPALVAAVFGIALLWKDVKAGKRQREAALLAIFIIQSVVWNALFWVQHFNTNNWLYYFATPVAMLGALTIDSLSQEGLGQKPRFLNLGIMVFCTILFVNSMLNLKEVHTRQKKLLPSPQKQLETLNFIPKLAAFVRDKTRPSDVVLTNIPPSPAAAEVFSYYSQRFIKWGSCDKVAINKAITEVKAPARVFVLLWNDNKELKQGSDDVYQNKEYNIAGHEFIFSSVSNK
jgi:uncharacterized membrane protein